jgi:ABC-type multidrug transport system fused ATPase/permease subunit
MLANVIIFAFVRSIMLIFFIPNAIISGKRINELFKLKPGIKSGKGKTINKNAKYVVEFENVNFKFTQTAPEDTIKNISFKLKQGETLAIIGATGSGKSIITKLIPRLFNPTNGKIKYYDKDIETYDLNFLRDSIGYVPQKTFLFNKSIKDNVSYGITKKMKQTEIDANVKEACKLACADQFINKFKDKYDHIISQNATNLSGGQKQRISIARALVRKPNLLIFDDSFSALDMTTDKTIRSNIKTKLKNTTKIIVAQRINTIIDAQNIVVVDRGQVVGQGTHKQLLKSCKVYYNFAISQLSRKELNNVK